MINIQIINWSRHADSKSCGTHVEMSFYFLQQNLYYRWGGFTVSELFGFADFNDEKTGTSKGEFELTDFDTELEAMGVW